jgi:hypothetical protein
MSTFDVQAFLKLALPLLAMLVSYIIQQAHWSDRANTWVAGITTLGAAGGSLFLQGQLTSNIYEDFLLIATLAAALQGEAFAPLQRWLRSNVISTSPKDQSIPRRASR